MTQNTILNSVQASKSNQKPNNHLHPFKNLHLINTSIRQPLKINIKLIFSIKNPSKNTAASKKSIIIQFLFYINRDTQHESSRSPTPLISQQMQQHLSTNGNYNTNGRSKRFSSPGYSDYGCDKVNSRNLNGKVGKRSIRSMNEAIEVLADQVEEENMVSLIPYDAESLNIHYFHL